MKKIISLLLAACLTAALLAGCGGTGDSRGNGTEQLRIVATIFPAYDWARQILGSDAENVELTLLLDSGTDLHSYQPTADDIITISTCDLFIYVGGESDRWVEDALKGAVNQGMTVICLLDALGEAVKEEELVEGMESEAEDADHGHEEPEYDEHVWLSLKNASVLCRAISQQLKAVDPANAGTYQANTDAYLARLDALDADYQAAVENAAFDTLLFGDRFPFRYLVDDYGLNYYAAFSGCSAETEASFETIAFLSDKLDELGLGAILVIEGTQHKIAETIVQNTASRDQAILTLDSMQAVTSADVEAGVTYLSIMENNLAVLNAALN